MSPIECLGIGFEMFYWCRERLEENSLTVQAMRATPREINGRKFETT